MNVEVLILIAVLALSCVGLALWAMAERGAAQRAALEARMLREQATSGAEMLKAQAALSASAVGEDLVRRASETFAAQDRLVQAKLEAQLKPVAETLEKFQLQVTAAEKARAEESGGLKAQIEQLLAASTATQDEARKLSAALRRGAGVQGRWGEQMLRNVLEMAGLKARVDFEEQVSVDAGALRPDVTVRLPGGGVFVIDAKCSLTAFLEAQDAVDEVTREAGYARHAQSVRAHMQSLAGKAYWDQFDVSPDFVVMFVPGDAFLAAAAERLPDLYAQGMERRVILVTPSSLFALCKAVVYGWRVEAQTINAREIVDLGRELYKRIAVMAAHAQAMGKGLETAVGRYNQFVGSLESQVHTQARRFEDLKVDHEGKDIAELTPIEVAVRPLTKLAPIATPLTLTPPTLTLGDVSPTSGS